MNKKIVIAARHVFKRYGIGETAFKALSDVNLNILSGESVAVVGKSGSGKSTLMHILALLDRPTEGQVYVDERNASHLKPRKIDMLRNRRYGFIFQQFFLNENDTVINNVILPLKIARVGRSERKARALQALQTVELSDKAASKAGTLSGGQKQRVCIARALINNPGVIFADEPTGNLDSHTGNTVEDLLFRLNREQGITLIIVTHDMELAARCSRRIFIKDGTLTTKGDL